MSFSEKIAAALGKAVGWVEAFWQGLTKGSDDK